MEDETYLWTVTRYVHLNPVRARLVEHPGRLEMVELSGLCSAGSRLPWVAHDDLLAAWTGEFGGSGSEPEASYRKYVTAGLVQPPESPWSEAFHGSILGSQKFVDRVRALVQGQPQRDRAPRSPAGAGIVHLSGE